MPSGTRAWPRCRGGGDVLALLRDRDDRRRPERAGRGRDPDAGRHAAGGRRAHRLLRGDRRRGGDEDGRRCRPASSVAVIGLGGVGLSAVMGARAGRRRRGSWRSTASRRSSSWPVRSARRTASSPATTRRRPRGDPRRNRRRPGHLLRGDRAAGDDRDRDRLPADRRDGLPGRDDAVRRAGVVRAVFPFVDGGRRILGSNYGSADPGGRLPALRGAPPRGPAADRPARHRRIGLDELEGAFERMRRGEGVRSVIAF